MRAPKTHTHLQVLPYFRTWHAVLARESEGMIHPIGEPRIFSRVLPSYKLGYWKCHGSEMLGFDPAQIRH